MATWLLLVLLALVALLVVSLAMALRAPAASLPVARASAPTLPPTPPAAAMPPRFSTGFGQPLKPLDAKPEALRTWAPSMEAYFPAAAECVPTDFPLQRVQDCPPIKPMSSALPPASVPMCMAALTAI